MTARKRKFVYAILVLFLLSIPVTGQSFRLKGRIVDTLKNPIPRTLISLVNHPEKNTLSNKKGFFSLRVKIRDTLLILPPGDNEEIFLAPVRSQKKEFLFILKSSGEKIVFEDKIIHAVQGVQKEKLKDFVNMLKESPQKYYTSIYDLISENYPQINIDRRTGKLYVRGMNNLNGNFPILIVVDGVRDVPLTAIDPNDVKSMHLISDGKASVYGDRAAGGVLEVITKKGR